ncbi:hypothetical protein ACFP1Z_05070 [Streptomyces gamaensis]|uniref:Integral membrane protein n=1 Tax=Streptomyces gamaensis TaxID=1763542 RepID=A0ABW0YSL3_9ACTN
MAVPEAGALAARTRALAVLRIRSAALAVALLPAAAAVVLLTGGATGHIPSGGGWAAARWAVAGAAAVALTLAVAVGAVVARARPALSPTVPIPEETAPDLYRLVRDLAERLGVPAPSAMALTPDCDSWLEDRTHPALGPPRGRARPLRRTGAAPVLVIGSPFLWWMRVAELRALLAPVVAGTGPSAHPDIAAARRFVRGLDAAVAVAAGRPVLAFVGGVARLLLHSCRDHVAEMERGVAAAASERAQTVDYGLRIAAQEQVGLAYAGWDRLLTRVALPAWRMGRWPSRLDAGVVAALTELSRRDRLAEGFTSRLGERPACDLLEEPGAIDEAASLLAARLFHGGPPAPGPDWCPVAWGQYPEEVVDRKWRLEAARLHRVLEDIPTPLPGRAPERAAEWPPAAGGGCADGGGSGAVDAAAVGGTCGGSAVAGDGGTAPAVPTAAGGGCGAEVCDGVARGGAVDAAVAAGMREESAEAADGGSGSRSGAGACAGPGADGGARTAGAAGGLAGPGGDPVAALAVERAAGGVAGISRPGPAQEPTASAHRALPATPDRVAVPPAGPVAAPDRVAVPPAEPVAEPAVAGPGLIGDPGLPAGGKPAAPDPAGAPGAPVATAGPGTVPDAPAHPAPAPSPGPRACGPALPANPDPMTVPPAEPVVAPGSAHAPALPTAPDRSAVPPAEPVAEPVAAPAPARAAGPALPVKPDSQPAVASVGRVIERLAGPAGSGVAEELEARLSAEVAREAAQGGRGVDRGPFGAPGGGEPWADGLAPLFPLQPPRSGRELLADHVTAMVCCAAVDTAGAAPGLDWLDGPALLVDGVRRADLARTVLSLIEDGDDGPLRSWLGEVGVRPEKPVRLG